ncbi:MAG: hypothetical protein FLDDKLPJ_00980 [Phycisphaerae bacterium]|nr:hypothetical protein [Phycisphaerae bacterium]
MQRNMRNLTGIIVASENECVGPARTTGARAWLRRFSPSLADAVFVLMFVRLLQLGATQFFNDPGTGWHLRVGEEILHARALPASDPFSWTRAGEPWIATQYLGEVALAAAYTLGGYPLVTLMCALVLAGLFRWVYRANIEAGAWPIWAIVVTMLGAAAASGQFLARPLLMTLVGVPLSFVVASAYASGKCGCGRLAGLVLLSLIWAQTHPGVLGGIVTVGLVGAGALFETVMIRDPAARRETVRRGAQILATAALMSLTTLATPHGLAWPASILELMRLQVLPRLVDEWQATDWTAPDGLAAAALLLLTITGYAMRHERPKAWMALVGGFWLLQAVQSGRHVSIFGLVLAVQAGAVLLDVKAAPVFFSRVAARIPLFSLPIRDRERRMQFDGVAPIAAIGILALWAASPDGRWTGLSRAGPPQDKYAFALIEHLRRDPPPQPIFNDINFGGHLIHHAPHLRVYVDDRFELYRDEFIEAYERVMTQPRKYAEAVFEQGGVRSVIVGASTPLASFLDDRPGWRRVYADPTACVFVREGRER